MRTVIPDEPTKLGTLGDTVVAKNTADGATSIIAPLVKDEVKVSIANLKQYAKRAEELRRECEEAYELRDNEAKKVTQFLRSVRDVVNANFPDQPKKLTEYGFEVNEVAPKAKKSDDKK
jgi:hypothetical protein